MEAQSEQRPQNSRPSKRIKPTPNTSQDEATLRVWHRLISGQTETISAANEAACKTTLLSLCETLTTEAEAAISALQALKSSDPLIDMVTSLWKSQKAIATALQTDLKKA
jgi:hypothetical protein